MSKIERPGIGSKKPQFRENSTGILVPVSDDFSLKKDDMQVTASGVILPTTARERIATTGLVASQLMIVTGPTQTDLKISDAEVLEFSTRTDTAEVPERGTQELAIAFVKPHLFLARELGKKFSGSSDVDEVKKYFETPDHTDFEFSQDVLKRKKRTARVYDRATGVPHDQEQTSPGPFEQVAIVTLDLLKESSLKRDARRVVLHPLIQVIRDFRINTETWGEAPEMPDMTMKIISMLEGFSAQPETRFALYSLLEQIKIPDSLRKEILTKMDKYEDLDHPLAYALTLEEAKLENSPWILIQSERRKALTDRLQGSNQEVFEGFDDLIKESRGLVYHGDFANPDEGKIGMEIEFIPSQEGKKAIYKTRKSNNARNASVQYHLRGKGLGHAWPIHIDSNSLHEATRADNRLEYGQGYERSLIDLYKWFGDNAASLESLHLHLDKTKHGWLPYLGGVFDGRDLVVTLPDGGQSIQVSSVGSSRRHGKTWEIRAHSLPQGIANFHPGRLADLISLYIHAAAVPNSTKSLSKIDASSHDFALPQLVWGHLTTFLQDPDARLTALMTLHDSHALKHVNPLAFIHTYTQESLKKITNTLKPVMKEEEDQAMLYVLERVVNNQQIDLFDDIHSDFHHVTEKVLGELSGDVRQYDYRLHENSEVWFERYARRVFDQLGHPISFPIRNEPTRRVRGDGQFKRDMVVEHIRFRAGKRVEKFREKLKDDTQEEDSSQKKRLKAREAFTQALKFDKVFLDFVDAFMLYQHPELDIYKGTSIDIQKPFFLQKVKDITAFLHLFFALENISDRLVTDLLEGGEVNFDEAFTFNEHEWFEETMGNLYKELEHFSTESKDPTVRRFKRMHDGDKEGKIIPVFHDAKDFRRYYSDVFPVLMWANDNGFIDDPRCQPIKELISSALKRPEIPFPTAYFTLLYHGFLGTELQGELMDLIEKEVVAS